MRVKRVTFDPTDEAVTTYCIAALNLGQVDTLITSPEGVSADELKKRTYELVCASLNNALAAQKAPDDVPRWTPERAREEFDLATWRWIQEQIMILSGLSVEPAAPRETTPGEARPQTVN